MKIYEETRVFKSKDHERKYFQLVSDVRYCEWGVTEDIKFCCPSSTYYFFPTMQELFNRILSEGSPGYCEIINTKSKKCKNKKNTYYFERSLETKKIGLRLLFLYIQENFKKLNDENRDSLKKIESLSTNFRTIKQQYDYLLTLPSSEKLNVTIKDDWMRMRNATREFAVVYNNKYAEMKERLIKVENGFDDFKKEINNGNSERT